MIKSTKSILGAQIQAKRPKLGPKLSFCHFLKFGSLVFLEIAYNGSLQQRLTSSKGKTHKKILGTKLWSKRPKIRPKISFFFCHFLKFVSLVFLEIAHNDSLQQGLKSSRYKIHEKKKKNGSPNLGQSRKNRA